MSLKNRTIAAVAPFAHLLGLAHAEDDDTARKGKRAKGAEEDDKDEKDKTDEDDNAKGKRAEGDDKDDKSAKAEDDKEKDDDTNAKKAKSKAEDDEEDGEADEDDSDDEMRGKGAAAAARRRERARCKAIFSCDAAGIRPDVAATLAFNTQMGRREAIAVLTSTAAGSQPRSGLADRMAAVNVPQAGAEGGADLPAGMGKVAAAIVAAGEKARAL